MEKEKTRLYSDDTLKTTSGLQDGVGVTSVRDVMGATGVQTGDRGAGTSVKRAKSETSSYYAKAASVFRNRSSRSELSRSTSMSSSTRGWLGRMFASRSAVAINPGGPDSGGTSGGGGRVVRVKPVGKCRSSDSIREQGTALERSQQRQLLRRRYEKTTFHKHPTPSSIHITPNDL